MQKSHKFVLALVLISIASGLLLSRYINRPQENEIFLNVITSEVVVIDSLKNDSIFSHSQITKKPFRSKEGVFRIHHIKKK